MNNDQKVLLFSEKVVKREKPVNLKDEDLPIFEGEFEKIIKGTSLYIVKDIEVDNSLLMLCGYKAHKKLTNSHSFLYTFRRFIISRFKNLIVNKSITFKKRKIFDNKVLWIIDNWSEGYFHWFADSLPRLYVVQNYTNSQSTILLPLRYKKYDFISESLKMFNVKVDYFSDHEIVVIGELLYPTLTAQTGNYNEEIFNNVRIHLLKNIKSNLNIFKPEQNTKVYISRAKAQKRKITNEDEVITLVKKYGFVVVYFEDLSWLEQVRFMVNSEYLISIHGAGLTNMLFMKESSKILELRNKGDCHNNCYFSMASALDFWYFYLECEGNSKNTGSVNIHVNIKNMEGVISKMLNN